MSLFFENLPGLVRLGNASVEIFSKFHTINNLGNLSAVHPSIEESRKLLPEVIFRDLFSDFSSRLNQFIEDATLSCVLNQSEL